MIRKIALFVKYMWYGATPENAWILVCNIVDGWRHTGRQGPRRGKQE